MHPLQRWTWMTLFTASSMLAADGSVLAKEREASTNLVVSVKGLRNDTGQVAVALFKSGKGFPDQKRALKGQVVAISHKQARLRFRNLAPGTYALAVLHDENKNDEMDFNLLGMPLEGYGFSNDASAMFGPPSFDEAKFTVGQDDARHTVHIRYFSL
jgi:uncharacterized protein (DUF2141 family)